MHVFFYEAFDEEEAAIRAQLGTTPCAGFSAGTVQETGHTAPPARLISTRTQSLIPETWHDMLDGILTRSTGYDHLRAYLNRTGAALPCGYLPLYCHRAVAEQAMLLWMCLLRRFPQQLSQFQSFHRDGLTGRECRGKVLLVVGVGNVGREVVDIGTALGMTVLGVDVEQRWPEVDYITPTAGLAQADVVVCAMNLTDANHAYFNRNRLQGIKRGAVFVNIARGELADSAALQEAHDAGRLAGIGLDVYSAEPELACALREKRCSSDPEVQAQLRLSRSPNVVCTPHNAFNTREAVARKAGQSIAQITHFRKYGRFLWPLPTP